MTMTTRIEMDAAAATTASETNNPLHGLLSDELLGRVFVFLAHGTAASKAQSANSSNNSNNNADYASLDGVRNAILVCRRWKDILYEPQFWRMAVGQEDKNSNNAAAETQQQQQQQRAGVSLLLATPTASGKSLNFNGFRRIATQTSKLENETRFLVHEHASQRRLVISSVIIESEDSPRELVEQLQVLSRLMQQGKLKDAYYKVGISVGERLLFVRCMEERLAHHLDSSKFRSATLSSAPLLKWENRHGCVPALRQKWPAIVDWIFEVSLWYVNNAVIKGCRGLVLKHTTWIQPRRSTFSHAAFLPCNGYHRD